MRSLLTPRIAQDAAHDVGNRSMRKAGRKVWNIEDYEAAVREYHRLLPCPKDVECDLCNA